MSRTMKTVYLIRHGETTSNIEHIIQGSTEPLTDNGAAQAHRLGLRMKKYPIDVIITSSHLRAKQTAGIIGRYVPKEIVTSQLFVERKQPSRIQGLADTDFLAEQVMWGMRDNFHNPEYLYEDGENFAECKARTEKALQFLLERPEQNIALVTHGVFLTFLINTAQFGELLTSQLIERATMIFPNTGVLKMEFGDHHIFSGTRRGWRIYPGDSSHLL